MFDFKVKRLLLLYLVLILVTFGTDMLIHQVLLKGDYEATKEAFRSEEAMKKVIGFMFAGQILGAIVFGAIYARGFATGCLKCAIIFGLMMGLVLSASFLVWYSLIPVQPGLWWKWILASLAQGVLMGIIANYVYGKAPLDKDAAKDYGLKLD